MSTMCRTCVWRDRRSQADALRLSMAQKMRMPEASTQCAPGYETGEKPEAERVNLVGRRSRVLIALISNSNALRGDQGRRRRPAVLSPGTSMIRSG